MNPKQLSKELHEFLYTEKPLEILDDVLHWCCGWCDGGCLILAKALQQWLREPTKLMLIIDDQEIAQHAVTQVGQYYLDGDGVSSERELLNTWKEQEHIKSAELVPYSELAISMARSMDGMPYEQRAADSLADLLRKHFDRVEVLKTLGGI